MLRRLRLLALPVLLIASVIPIVARADSGDPILKEDSAFEATEWGYKLKSLEFDLSREWPTILYMEGYGGAGTPNAYLRMDDGELMALNIRFARTARDGGGGDYAYVRASIRGTECSGGGFNLYDRRHAWDGYHIVEWIAAQPWSNENVGAHGSSLSGQTAYWIATTRPPHLKAVSANLLHSDIYRDIFMVGGIQNNLFPAIWTYGTGPHRLPTEAQDNGTLASDEICQQNQASRYSPWELPQPQQEPLWAAIGSTDNDWYTAHAALTYTDSIRIPYYQQSNWQDEQVGPRGLVLFNHINPDPVTIIDRNGAPKTVVPKKMVTSTGDHGWGQFHNRDLESFMNIFLRDMPDTAGIFDNAVETYWETRADPPNSPYTAMKAGSAWPFPDTDWRRLYLHGDGSADFSPAGLSGDRTYLSGVARQNWFWYTPGQGSDITTAQGLPDQLEYISAPLDDQLIIAGPIMMSFWAQMAGTDADFFVSISDVYPDGSVSYLQRGWLKASHRAVDPERSYYTSGGLMYQPYMSHTNPQPVPPNTPIEYKLEIFPLGHIFRANHQILIQVHTPPIVDGLWGYTPTHHQPAAVTFLHDGSRPAWVQLPVVTPDGPIGAAPSGCKVPGGFPCTAKSRLSM